mmetsp:Transcript_30917/g.66389  ORF Transcript_30917/g.66389 Transcript_30917/m.66389 type:complete len:734 (-) Transcript_30917:392-2593(-)
MASASDLDASTFSPPNYINKLFPTEESLARVDGYASELEASIAALDEEVLITVRQQTSAGSSARKDLELGKVAMAELFGKVREIKGKAERSEQMVHDICSDIKSLDNAKRHLTLTITALKRLQMLVTAAEQLAVMTRERMYVEAANLLQAVNQLLSHFEDYAGIAKIDELTAQIGEIRDSLRAQVFEDFNRLSSQDGTPQHSQLETLSGACAVVDALGTDVRRETLAWFSNWQFAPYKHAFQPYGEAGSLEKTELRYAWQRQLLKQYDDLFCALFPPSWQAALVITREYCSITRAHLDEILDQSRGALDVAVLTHALQKTIEFEKEMDARFSMTALDCMEGDEGEGEGEGKDTEPRAPNLIGSISGSFDSYMSIYVSLEDKSIEEALSKLLADETWTASAAGRADSRVFNSSQALFIALKRSFKRGTALHMSAVLFELVKVWSKHLRAYAKKVDSRLPSIQQPTDLALPPICNLDQQQQQMVCAVVNTCKYCHETTAQLEESIVKVIDDEYSDKIDLSPVKEEFQAVVTTGMRVLVAALETRAAPALATMSKLRWDTMEELGEDTSPYMLDIVAKAREIMPQLGESLMPLYVKFFCDKFVESFVPRLIGNMYHCKAIGMVGAQQMQVDVGTLKQTLVDLPTLGQATPTSFYVRMVNDEISKAELVLKLVQTPEEMLEMAVEELRTSGTAIDLRKILELKGLRSERLTEAYNLMTGSASEGSKKIKKLFNLGTS